MRSGELAALAGVTVRTLRHYHQLGLLDEPHRSVNGYRRYDVRHLVRVLRIVRLTGLGLPLATLPEILAEPGAADAVLAELDRETAAEIDRLTARRATIAELRREGATPDTPAWLTPYAAILAESAATAPELARFEREQLILLGHLAGEAARSVLVSAYERMEPGDGLDTYHRFHALGPDSSDAEVERLVGDFVEQYGDLLRDLGDGLGLKLSTGQDALLAEHTEYFLNERQREAVLLLQQRLDP